MIDFFKLVYGHGGALFVNVDGNQTGRGRGCLVHGKTGARDVEGYAVVVSQRDPLAHGLNLGWLAERNGGLMIQAVCVGPTSGAGSNVL